MFTDVKSVAIAEIPTTLGAVYTVPAGANNRAQLTQGEIHNTGSLAADVTVFHNNGSDVQRYAVTLQANDSLVLFTLLQLNAGHSLKAVASAEGVNIFIDGREFIE
jgi:hypothetical protein